MVDSVDTRVLWSERAVGIQGYGTEEENPRTGVKGGGPKGGSPKCRSCLWDNS